MSSTTVNETSALLAHTEAVTSAACTTPEHAPLVPGHGAGAASAKLSPSRPHDSAYEIRLQVRLASPVILAYLLQSGLQLVAVLAIGRLGPLALGAAALANMYCSVTAFSILIGVASALDTLCAQAFTHWHHDKTALGVYLQRGLVVSWLACIPMCLAWYYSEPVLLYLAAGDAELAAYASLYTRTLAPMTFAYAGFECLKRFLQAQGIMSAATQVLLLCTPISFALCYVLVGWLGFRGAPLAIVLVEYLCLFLLVAYTAWIHPTARDAWGGLHLRAACRDLSPLIRLAIPGTVMICAEWWAFECVAIAASHLGRIPLAAQSVLLNVCTCLYMIPLGVAVAASTRVGHLLGAGAASRARRAARCALILILVVAGANTLLLFVTRHHLAWAFTSDPDVIRLTASVVPICALFQLADGVCAVCGGILRGMGRPTIGAVFNFTGYYGFALPLGVYLAFWHDFGLAGLWWGLCVALTWVATGETLAVTWWADWSYEVVRCRERLRHGAVHAESGDSEVSVASATADSEQEEVDEEVVLV